MERRPVLLLAVAVVVTTLAGSVGAVCPSGYHRLPYGSCVKLLPLVGPHHTSWEEANDKCIKEGGQLISLDTPAKMESFSTTVSGLEGNLYDYPYWVGATKTESGWRWLNGAELSPESYMWLPDEPQPTVTHAQIVPMRDNVRHYMTAIDFGRGSACEADEV